MIFSAEAVNLAAGGVLAHGLKGEGFSFKKGRVLSTDDVAVLAARGFRRVVIARLEPEDVGEDQAAAAIAAALAGTGIEAAAAATGRANLHAATHGLLQIDIARINRANLIDEALTVATLAESSVVVPGQMLATVKIIPFAVPRRSLERCLETLRQDAPALAVAPFRAHRAGLVQTRLPGIKASVLEKTRRVTAARLEALGSSLDDAVVVGHDEDAVAAAIVAQRQQGLDPVLIVGASATVDRRDIVPAAIVQAGGEIVHFGMPVDPGNLLLLARLDGAAVIGLPGCARSPQANGFDMVLHRLLAELPVGAEHIMGWGVGGLLMEIPQRPLPRQAVSEAQPRADFGSRIGAIVLAAGQGTRMGKEGKMLLQVEGRPLLRPAVEAAQASRACCVVVVTGYRAQEVRASLAAAPVVFAHNPDFADGLAGSLAIGIRNLPGGLDGVVVLLGDMPRIRSQHIDALIEMFEAAPPDAICVPVHGGRRGNPVLWPATLLPQLAAQEGDKGGRELLRLHAAQVRPVEMADDAVLVDIDEPRDLAALAGATSV